MYKNKRSCARHSHLSLINKNKRAQFFLLAAVIISLVIISLSATTNRVATQESNFQDIDDFSYQVKKETGEVLNYEIYEEVSNGKVEEFARLMAEDIQDRDPDTEFVFVFGNNEGMSVSNYGEDDIEVVTTNLETATYCWYTSRGELFNPNRDISREECSDQLQSCYACSSNTCLNLRPSDSCVYLYGETVWVNGRLLTEEYCVHDGGVKKCSDVPNYEPGEYDLTADDLQGKEYVTVVIDGVDVVVPVSEYRQVQLIIKRESQNETYFDY